MGPHDFSAPANYLHKTCYETYNECRMMGLEGS